MHVSTTCLPAWSDPPADPAPLLRAFKTRKLVLWTKIQSDAPWISISLSAVAVVTALSILDPGLPSNVVVVLSSRHGLGKCKGDNILLPRRWCLIQPHQTCPIQSPTLRNAHSTPDSCSRARVKSTKTRILLLFFLFTLSAPLSKGPRELKRRRMKVRLTSSIEGEDELIVNAVASATDHCQLFLCARLAAESIWLLSVFACLLPRTLSMLLGHCSSGRGVRLHRHHFGDDVSTAYAMEWKQERTSIASPIKRSSVSPINLGDTFSASSLFSRPNYQRVLVAVRRYRFIPFRRRSSAARFFAFD